jgi:hypothetical protein
MNYVVPLLQPRGKDAGEGGEGGEEGEGGAAAEEENVVYTYVPPVPKDWVHLGSEKEIEEESLRDNRPLVRTLFS